MKNNFFLKILLTVLFFMTKIAYANVLYSSLAEQQQPTTNIAPIITATGDQIYCPQTYMKIVTDVSIVDPDDTGIDAVYIQISSGYVYGQDQLVLNGSHPTITYSWDITSAKLKLYSPVGLQVSYVDFIAAIKDIVFNTSSISPSGNRDFSISIGQANYLPSTDHYYEFVSDIGITWTDAKVAAENRTYYGLQGYLATILSSDEAFFVGKQASGTGWIGGTDQETEGVWKWVTGPESGTVFWNGLTNGTIPNFAFWNSQEPNNLGNENYAHITAPGVGISGSWNDLANSGADSGSYQPKGYIVEYGGMPGDPILHISASTSMAILLSPTNNPSSGAQCIQKTLTIPINFTDGTLEWYDVPTGGTSISTGNTFTTPILTKDITFYYDYGCAERRSFAVEVIPLPDIISTNNPIFACATNEVKLEATTSAGNVNWYTSLTSSNIEVVGENVTIPNIKQSSIYYAEAADRGCSNGQRVPVNITVYELPNVFDEEIIICQGKSVPISAGVSNMKYLWSTGEETQTIRTNGLNNYAVVVTSPSPENCSKTKNFTIIEHTAPKITDVVVNEFTATIITDGFGDFEYSVDGKNYQDSTIFTIEKGGQYTAYVREKNNCGKDAKTFVIISIPKFFTPNNDGSNDFWTVKSIENYPAFKIDIFDRYGKYITQLSISNKYWNGTLNGKPLPADDYWYVAKIDDSIPEKRGHFSLKR